MTKRKFSKVYHWTNFRAGAQILKEGLLPATHVCITPKFWIGEVCVEARTDEQLDWLDGWHGVLCEPVPRSRLRVVEMHTFGDEAFQQWLLRECEIHPGSNHQRCGCGTDNASSTISVRSWDDGIVACLRGKKAQEDFTVSRLDVDAIPKLEDLAKMRVPRLKLSFPEVRPRKARGPRPSQGLSVKGRAVVFPGEGVPFLPVQRGSWNAPPEWVRLDTVEPANPDAAKLLAKRPLRPSPGEHWRAEGVDQGKVLAVQDLGRFSRLDVDGWLTVERRADRTFEVSIATKVTAIQVFGDRVETTTLPAARSQARATSRRNRSGRAAIGGK